MKSDPPVRLDGCCVVCGKPRRPERSKRYGQQHAALDPFCSSDCCRVYHGTVVTRSIWSRESVAA